jgi:acyl-CoA reductase-like NAD-dependent aldehyde dehydrogenase
LVKHSPTTGEVLAELECTDPAQVAELTARARKAQVAWAALGVRERNRRLARAGHVMARRSRELAELIAAETGKPVLEAAVHEVLIATDLVQYFSKRAHKILAPQRIPLHLFMYRKSYVHYVPRGVVGVVSPWNFPFMLAAGEIFMALSAGNAVVHKPSEWTPRIGLEFPKILIEAEIDPELVQVALGYGDVGQAVVESGVDMVHFTGSVATGRKVAALCGERLIPCVLELGGKDAAIVLDDADLDHAAETIVLGAFLNSGQACASIERVYATPGIYQALVDTIVGHVEKLRLGDGLREDIDLGPMIMPRQLEIVRRHVDEAKARGATVRTGGTSRGSYFFPTVLTEVTDDMAVCKEETFGPVLPVMKVRDIDEAVRRANLTEYGLAASVFTRNVERGREVAERVRAGSVHVNEALLAVSLPEAPWGGVRESGIGVSHSAEGLRGLCEARHVNYSPLPAFRAPWLFPYARANIEAITDIIRGLWGGEALLVRGRRLVSAVWAVARYMRRRFHS